MPAKGALNLIIVQSSTGFVKLHIADPAINDNLGIDFTPFLKPTLF